MEIVVIDGSYGEGGGQVLRTSLSLSCLLKRPIVIEKIRAGRKNPGLQPQHLTSVKASAEITRAKVEGAFLGSERLLFEPETLLGGEYSFDVAEKKGSAGSVGLVLQTILPLLSIAKEPSRVKIKGGTHTEWSPPFHYIQEVFLLNLSKMGLSALLSLERWGFYPLGGGEIKIEVEPVKNLSGREWKRGELKRIKGISAVANLPRSIAERQRDQALLQLRNEGFEGEIEIVEAEAKGKGTFLFLDVEYEGLKCGFSSLGERGKPAEKVADETINSFLSHHRTESALDPNMADQILLYSVLAEGRTHFTTSQITNHLITNLWVIHQFLPKMGEILGEIGKPGTISIKT